MSGYFAPPPGSRTGVADYAEHLRKALGAFEGNLYHLGNNRLHREIYARALAVPGVIVLHDAVLHHFLLGTMTREEYLAEWVFNYGEWRRHLGEDLWEQRASSAIDSRYFEYPMLRRIVEASKAVIVHNAGAAAIAEAHGAKRVSIIPHFYEPPEYLPDASDTARFRQRHGIPQQVTLFGIFGYLRETKRVLPCIHAFRKLHKVIPQTALLIAGEAVSESFSRLIESEAQDLFRLPHLSEKDFWIAASAIDCCLNLRHPAAGETSGIAIRMMGLGKPVILTEGKETQDVPAAACLRIPAGPDEAPVLFDTMALIAAQPRIARDIGAQAQQHIGTYHRIEDAAHHYGLALDVLSG